MMWSLLFCLIGLAELGFSLLAFDCASPTVNITTFSLLDSAKCDNGDNPVRSSNTTIQLLQLKRWDHFHVFHCKINVIRTINYCGMHSHTSLVQNGLLQYILPISKQQCIDIHVSSIWNPSMSMTMDGLTGNRTHHRSATLSGEVDSSGTCKGGSYSDTTGSWSNVVVQATYQISLYDQEVLYDVDSGILKLPSGTTCMMSNIECIDIEKGYTFWTSSYESSCNSKRHNVLYEGLATRMEEIIDPKVASKNIVYIVQNDGFSFTFSIKSRTTLCGIGVFMTDHPRLMIHHPEDGVFYFQKTTLMTEDMDMFAYINSKFVYVEQHLKSQMVSLYHNTMKHKCALEQQMIHNLMNLAISDPELFAYSYMKVPGYTAVRAGELIHVVKCMPVDVSVRATERCYNDLPIVYNNQTKFITPRNHLIVNKGTEVPCTPMMYPAYRLQGSWFEMSPQLHEVNSPHSISISASAVWKYKSPYELAVSGIYSEKDLDKLRDHIMFPAERQAITNIIAQGVNQMNPDLQHLSIMGLMDKTALDQLTDSYIKRMWGAFVWVGNAVSGVMGLWLTWKCLCFLWNTAVHGLSLYQTFGMSLKLLTAVSGSLSHYFLHQDSKRRHGMSKDDIEMRNHCLTTDDITHGKSELTSPSAPNANDVIVINHNSYPHVLPHKIIDDVGV